MANLKIDLLNKLQNDKYFEESELVRLAGEANMNYRQKIDDMSWVLQRIAIVNAQIGLVEQYFKEPQPQQGAPDTPAPAPVQQPAPTNVHQGQTHGE